jgi:hypothetical protein
MKIKIGDKITDSNVESVVLIFDSIQDKKEFRKNLRGMAVTELKFDILPNATPQNGINKFMRTE